MNEAHMKLTIIPNVSNVLNYLDLKSLSISPSNHCLEA